MNLKEGAEKIYNSKSRSFLIYCGFFILGVGIFSLLENDVSLIISLKKILFIFFLIVIFLLTLFFKNNAGRFGAICLLLFCLGSWRALSVLPSGNLSEITSLIGRQFTVEGAVVEVDKSGRYFFKADNYHGRILVAYNLYPIYHYGDRWRLNCQFSAPEPYNDFRYDKYLLNKGVYAICKLPDVALLSGFGGNKIKAGVFSLKELVGEKIKLLWPEPEAGLMAGLLYGEKSALPAELLNNFNRTGLTHIIAVSGYNTSVIVVAVLAGLIFVGFWRRQAIWLSAIILFIFVIFTGATASVTRAALLAVVGLTAQLFGRPNRSFNALVLAATIMVAFKPLVIFYDAGFQLSFLAVVGVMYLGPSLAEIFKVSEDNILCATMGAIILTLPLLAYQFGKVSLVAPLSNLLILWVIPFLMLSGFVATVFGLIFLPLGQIFAFIAHLGLKYVILIVNWLGGLWFASREISLSIYLMILAYILIILFLSFPRKRESSGGQSSGSPFSRG
ncbi:MAG: hypothetical protein A2538_04130 [Candidatus Magasanikbacteria bacterium RIFOXYD2_FULL_41_14]|uniref:ComEC/Rec2-related protein domain-containing protein n=1 Tax=Candidatus Magasanikbacteria bacterium RIFOXYD2_FULL_41_14 TaxID=1798709 RepID=A0A1F6PG57_9BACT|nr:MAG: hypothetical protein A2538_04130 [Candidatus Magasanikbacteria bacterium RIFOXYD2_FULL_41_14]